MSVGDPITSPVESSLTVSASTADSVLDIAPSFVMSNGVVTVTWGPKEGTWQITSLATSSGSQSFEAFDLWQVVARSSGATEVLFPLFACQNVAAGQNVPNDEKLAIPFGAGVIKKAPSFGVGVAGIVDAALLVASGFPTVSGVPVLEFPNPGTASMQWTALYSFLDKRGFYTQTDDLAGQRKDYGYAGVGGLFTLLSTRMHAVGPVGTFEADTSLSPSDSWSVAFVDTGSNTWTVTYTQRGIRSEDGFDIAAEQVVSGTSDPDFLEIENPIVVVVGVELVDDEARLSITVTKGLTTYSFPYKTRATYMAGRLYDFARRYRTWALANESKWIKSSNDPADTWLMDPRYHDDATIHIVFGATGVGESSFDGYQAAMDQFTDIFLGGQKSRLSTYWGSWHLDDKTDALQGTYWPDWSPVKPGLREAMDDTLAAGYQVGLYVFPPTYHQQSTYYTVDRVAADLTLIDVDGALVTVNDIGDDGTTLSDRVNLKVGITVMLERWRHAWLDFHARGNYHDVLSGTAFDAFPDRRSTLNGVGGTSNNSEGMREWIVRCMQDQARPMDVLEDESGGLILDETTTGVGLQADFDGAPEAILDENGNELVGEDGAPIGEEINAQILMEVE